MGKGLSKDAKAQKLAFQHWIEAVSLHYYPLFYCQEYYLLFNYLYFSVFDQPSLFYIGNFDLIGVTSNCRSIHAIAMGITCNTTIKNGVKRMPVNHSFIGKVILLE